MCNTVDLHLIQVHIVKCKVDVSCVATFKIWKIFTSKLESQSLGLLKIYMFIHIGKVCVSNSKQTIVSHLNKTCYLESYICSLCRVDMHGVSFVRPAPEVWPFFEIVIHSYLESLCLKILPQFSSDLNGSYGLPYFLWNTLKLYLIKENRLIVFGGYT